MTVNWRHGWFLDRAPLVAVTSSGGTGSAGKYYFEVKLTTTNGFATGTGVFGICNSSANLARIVDVNVNTAQGPGAITWYGDPNGGSNTFGYPNKTALVGPGTWLLNETMSVAVDTTAHRMWVFVPQTSAWVGNGGPLPSPITGVNGADFASGGLSPITGSIYAFVGGTNTSGVSYGGVTVNFGATAFVRALPTGYSAWGATEILNPADNSNLTLSGGNLVANAASAITGTNGPAAIVRSRGRKAQS